MAQAGAICRHQIAKCVQEPSIRVPPVPLAGEHEGWVQFVSGAPSPPCKYACGTGAVR